MPNPSERRARPDRRKAPRGGRRPGDLPGTTPLVMVVGHGGTPRRESETILARLNFAVAPTADVAEALRVVESLKPDLIVARPQEATTLRESGTVAAPIVEFNDDQVVATALVDLLRGALRKQH
jgi:hypothetical protein